MHPTADASGAINRAMQDFYGTAKGAAQFIYNNARFLNDQGLVAANAATGGWLAENSDATRDAVGRNAALGKALVALPEKASALALRALTGNFTLDEVRRGVNTAMRTDEIAALVTSGDYAGAQAIRTENALNVATLLLGAAPAIRGALTELRLGGQLAAEDFGASRWGQNLGLQLEQADYNLGLRTYVVPPERTFGNVDGPAVISLNSRAEYRAASLNPQPNTTYQYSGLEFTTDKLGRGVNSSGTLTLGSGGNRFYDDRLIGHPHNLDALPGDIGFHAGADMFGFPGGQLNVFPGNKVLNSPTGAYGAFEKNVLKPLVADPNNTVHAEFGRIFYEVNLTSRPDELQIIYTVNNRAPVTTTFLNR